MHTYLSDVFIKAWELHRLPMHITAGYITAAHCPDFSKDKPEKLLSNRGAEERSAHEGRCDCRGALLIVR